MKSSVELEETYTKFMKIIETEFAGNPERLAALNRMYGELKSNLMYAPASSKKHFHNAYIGGYMDHVMNVYYNCLEMVMIYVKRGGKLNFTKEELVFAALHHDLGKIGDNESLYYTDQPSEWHREKLGELFKVNHDPFIKISDRTFWLLNEYGVKYTKNEMLGINLADGLYEEGNKDYLKNVHEFPIHTALPYILHWSDHMACVTEKLNLFFQIKA